MAAHASQNGSGSSSSSDDLPLRNVIVATGAISNKGGGVFFLRCNKTGRSYYKFYSVVSRCKTMHSSHFEQRVGANALKYFQRFLAPGDAVTFILDKTGYINLNPNSEFSVVADGIKKASGIDVRVDIMSKIENLYLQAADFIANDCIGEAHKCMKAFGAEHWP